MSTSGDAGELQDESELHSQPFVLRADFHRTLQRPQQLKLILCAHNGFRFLSSVEVESFHQDLLYLRFRKYRSSIVRSRHRVRSTHSFPLPLDFGVDHAASGFLSTHGAECVPIRL